MSLGFGSSAAANQAQVSYQVVDGPSDSVTDTTPPLTVNLETTFGPTGANLATGFANTFQGVLTRSNFITHTHGLRAAAEIDASEAGSATVVASAQIEQPYRLVLDPGVEVDSVDLRLLVAGDGSILVPLDGDGNPLGSAQVSAGWLLWNGDPDDPDSFLLDSGSVFQDETGFGAGPFDFTTGPVDLDGDGILDVQLSDLAGTAMAEPSVSPAAHLFLQADLFTMLSNDLDQGLYILNHADTLTLSLTSLTPGVTVVAIPEPGAATLLALPLAGLLGAYRRRG
jgi:hypothetical protein